MLYWTFQCSYLYTVNCMMEVQSLGRVLQDQRIKNLVSMRGKNWPELEMDFKRCQGKDKAIKVFFRKEIYPTAEIFLITLLLY